MSARAGINLAARPFVNDRPVRRVTLLLWALGAVLMDLSSVERRRLISWAIWSPCWAQISALFPVTPELGLESAPQPTEARAIVSGKSS